MTSRSLLPREHGAYGQLGVPLVTALASGRPGLAAGALAAAAIAGFLVHEPVLVLAGHRGARVLREHGARARRRVAQYGATIAAGGALGLALGGATVALAAAAVGALAAVAALLVVYRRERTLGGEIWLAATLAAAAVPVALAGGLALRPALAAWATWALGFAAVTGAVRGSVAAAKARPRGALIAAVVLATAAAGVLVAAVDRTPAAAAPLVGLALALTPRPPSPRHLRRVGWVLITATVATGAALVVVAQLG